MFLDENAFFKISESKIRKKNPTFYSKDILLVRNEHTNFQGNVSTNNLAITG